MWLFTKKGIVMGYEWWLSGEWLSVSWVRGYPHAPKANSWRILLLHHLESGWWFGTMEFYDFPHIYIYIGNFIIPTDFHSFQRGRFTTNQESLGDIGRFCLGMIWISSNFRIDLPCNEALRPPKTRIYSHRSNLQRLRFHAISTRGSENGSNEASGSVQDKFHMWYFRHEKWKEP